MPGMRARSISGGLLLTLAALSVLEITVDGTAVHVSMRQQCWTGAPQQGTGLPQRGMAAIVHDPPASPLLSVTGLVMARDHFDLSPPLLPSIFVPPRA
jgi:hypothetical protein